MPLLIHSNSNKNFQSKGNKNSAKFPLMPKNFCGFCKVFCSKKICRNKKKFSKKYFFIKKFIKKFRFFYRFFSFSPVKVSRFLSPSPSFHRIFSPLKSKHHTSSFHQNTTPATYTYFIIIPALSSLSSLFSLTAINILFI